MLACHFLYYLTINIWGQCAHLMLQLSGLQISLRDIIKTLRLYAHTTIATHLGYSKLSASRRCRPLNLLVIVLIILLVFNECSKVALGDRLNFSLQRDELHF